MVTSKIRLYVLYFINIHTLLCIVLQINVTMLTKLLKMLSKLENCAQRFNLLFST